MIKTWTKAELAYEVERTYQDLKSSGYTKADAKKEVLKVVKAEGITILK